MGSRRHASPIGLLVCALALAAAGCAQSSWSLPDGILASPSDRGKLVVGGIYAATTRDDQSCCWVRRQSQFRVARTQPATDLVIEIYLPDVAVFRDRPQAVDITLNGSYRFHKCCYGPGDHAVLLNLPPAIRDAKEPIDVSMTMRETFVPARALETSNDQRSLAAILVGVTFRQY